MPDAYKARLGVEDLGWGRAAFLLFPSLLRQTDVTATASGIVPDPRGAGVGDANVTLKNPDTGLVRRLKTPSGGGYEFLSVPVGE